MKPLICFYKDGLYLYSSNYALESCPANTRISNFLSTVDADHRNSYKVLQINFEYDENKQYAHQKSLYEHPKASVFILKHFEILNEDEILNRLPETNENLKFDVLESQDRFCNKVLKIKSDIGAGRIYQVNLTAPLRCKTASSSESLFKKYFRRFNGDHKAFLPFHNKDVLSFSPEMFLKKTASTLITQPIKGSVAPEQSFDKDLILNRKEEAELSMIVDLLRNDLNRINADLQLNNNQQACEAVVTQHRSSMQLGYIQHTYSEIKIQTEKALPEILDCTMPGGSISGCPKIESLKLIAELETYKRQIYTGCIGWWKDGDFSLNLSIRTFIKVDSDVFYHAGCGVVYDSIAEHEWSEFLLKTARISQ